MISLGEALRLTKKTFHHKYASGHTGAMRHTQQENTYLYAIEKVPGIKLKISLLKSLPSQGVDAISITLPRGECLLHLLTR